MAATTSQTHGWALLLLWGVAALVIGVINIFGAAKAGLSWGGSLLGVAQVIIGIFLVSHPLVGILALVPTLGILAIAGGIVTIVASFKVKHAVAA